MAHKLKPQDEGKRLVTPSGDVVGVLERIEDEQIYVCPDPDLLTGYGSWICGTIQNVRSFRLDEGSVAEIDSDRVVLEQERSERSRVKSVH